MVHVRVSDEYIHFALMYTPDNIFYVIPIKNLVNQDGEPMTPHKMSTVTNTLVSNLRVLLCTCIVQKVTEHVDTKALNMCHQSKKGFRSIFVGIPQHKKGYLIYIPSTRKIVSSHDVICDKTFSSTLVYTLCPYSESHAMRPAVSYIPYTT